jgi:acetoin utilization protein AcuB
MTDAKDLMSNKVITILDTSMILDAEKLMKKHNIRHLPVMNQEGRLMGMLNDRDLQMAFNLNLGGSSGGINIKSKLNVEHFMTWPIHTVDENTPVRDLVNVMVNEKISAVVVNSRQHYIKGIITTQDLLKYLVTLIDSNNFAQDVSDQNDDFTYNHNLQ